MEVRLEITALTCYFLQRRMSLRSAYAVYVKPIFDPRPRKLAPNPFAHI